MKAIEFEKLQEMRREEVLIFTLQRVEKWMADSGLRKGDIILIGGRWSGYSPRTGMTVQVGPSQLQYCAVMLWRCGRLVKTAEEQERLMDECLYAIEKAARKRMVAKAARKRMVAQDL